MLRAGSPHGEEEPEPLGQTRPLLPHQRSLPSSPWAPGLSKLLSPDPALKTGLLLARLPREAAGGFFSAGNIHLVATLLAKPPPSATALACTGAVTWERLACRNPASAES